MKGSSSFSFSCPLVSIRSLIFLKSFNNILIVVLFTERTQYGRIQEDFLSSRSYVCGKIAGSLEHSYGEFVKLSGIVSAGLMSSGIL